MKIVTKTISLLLVLTLFASVFLPFDAFADSVIPGDVTCDGKVLANDAREILLLSVGITKPEKDTLLRADVDRDGSITAADARKVLRISIGFMEKESAANAACGEIIGYTENGFLLYNIDGATYIDGVLIVNKTYSLPSSFSPEGLLPECSAAFREMQSAASQKGLSLYISSGYRSFSSQKTIYNRYVKRDGVELADTYSARPGHSEHQTGLAIDLNTIKQSFANTAEGKWVAAHCHEYGFIIRYPKGKSHITGYCYEPWHLRYVGVETATKIYNSGLCLEEYYGITSVYS